MSLPPLFQGNYAPTHRFGEGRRVDDLLNLTPRGNLANQNITHTSSRGGSRRRTPSQKIKGPTPPTTTNSSSSGPTRLNTCNTVSTSGRRGRGGAGGGASRSPNRLHSPSKTSPMALSTSTSTTTAATTAASSSDVFGVTAASSPKKKAIYVEERTRKGISVHPVGDNETRLGSTLVGSEASRIRAQLSPLTTTTTTSSSSHAALLLHQQQQRDAIMMLASNEETTSRIRIKRSAHSRFYTPPSPHPPSPLPPADVSDRIAFVNCVIVPRGLVCLEGSDLFKAAYVLLRYQLLCYSPTSDSPPTLISSSSVPMEMIREYQRSSASFLSMSGTATANNTPATTSLKIPGVAENNQNQDDEEAASMVLLRPQYVGTAKSDFCEMVKEEERDALLGSSQNMTAAVREATIAKALHLRLNSLEYVHYLQAQHDQHRNVFTPAELTAVGEEGTRLIGLFTVELSNTIDGSGESEGVLACDIELPRPEDVTDRLEESHATTTHLDHHHQDGGVGAATSTSPSEVGNMVIGTPSWNTWWCVHGNPDPDLTETTCIDGTSNPRLQKRSVLGSFGITMRRPEEEEGGDNNNININIGADYQGGASGQLCINVGRLPAIKTTDENGQPAEDEVPPPHTEGGHTTDAVNTSVVTEIIVEDDDFGMEGEYDDVLDSGMLEEPPTPYFLHIGAITMDRALMEQTLGTAEAFHNYRRSASMEASMSWKRTTNASIRITIDPHYPGLPQSLMIPVEPREEPPMLASSSNNGGGSKGVSFKVSDRAVLIPEYVRRAEDRYLAIHFPNDDSKVVLEAGDRQSATFQEFMAAEHEKQEWKIPIKRTHGELKLSATLQLQGAGNGSSNENSLSASRISNSLNTNNHNKVAPVMTQGTRYLDMRACYKAVNLYAHKVSARQDAANEEGVDVKQYGPNIKQPALRLSLLSLKHSFGGGEGGGGGGISSRDRSEITLVGNVLGHARQELLHITPSLGSLNSSQKQQQQ